MGYAELSFGWVKFDTSLLQLPDDDDTDLDANTISGAGWFLRGALRYFVTQSLRLQGDAQWTTGGNDGLDSDVITLVGTAEYRLASVPLSGFGSVRWDSLSGDLDGSTTTFSIGIRGY